VKLVVLLFECALYVSVVCLHGVHMGVHMMFTSKLEVL